MLDSDWSRKLLLRSDWSGLKGALLTTINLLKKTIKLDLLFKLSYLNSNFAFNLAYFDSYLFLVVHTGVRGQG